jgi:D-beta-D-heptose 7-phosphate kinase/D-beta-D-heptose 1-phosphate adenosyltransferase
MPRRVAVSGGFDPLHIGHLEMMREARALGDALIVILNNDHWLRAKKGHAFMPEHERAALIREYPFVDEVVITSHPPEPTDMSVCAELRAIRPEVFANGGDRKSDNTPEGAVCQELGIELAWNAGASGKIQSSSDLIAAAMRKHGTKRQAWGELRSLLAVPGATVREIALAPGASFAEEGAGLGSVVWLLLDGAADVVIADGEPVPLATGVPMVLPHRTVRGLSSATGATILETVYAA